MIIKYLENLRKQSPEVRKTYALFFTTVITATIVAIWVVTIYINNLGTRSVDETDNNPNKKQTTSDLFESSNTFVDDKETTNSNLREDWTQDLRQFDDESLTKSPFQTDEVKTVETVNTATSSSGF